jgi:antitoxin (DNA-binding transcriptional repressor) of toxin-antitoxin stability system
MKYATTHEAKTHLSRMLREVRAGEEYVIMNGREPVGKLIAFNAPTRKRPKVGTVTSPGTKIADDAFAPMTDEQLAEWGL